MDDLLLFCAKLVRRRARDKIQQGEIPQYLSLEGSLALIQDKTVRYMRKLEDGLSDDEVLDLAVDALVAVTKVISPLYDSLQEPESESETLESIEEKSEDAIPEYIEPNEVEEEDSDRWSPAPKFFNKEEDEEK